ncbi:P-loop containing nucleoside triphosphate hydrolase protein [Artomyces pyxidatus]|uniref:P-loop containing nucleoside triphosphate hydrolase protein n=1 Tax=Artomyces pyxidatus TaxID=48021 RepID=A0ACB8SR97_9AGAM|nr:P-loop containing nucleoside triphosphate hydrolase protein [Artomyces pyxidatus]
MASRDRSRQKSPKSSQPPAVQVNLEDIDSHWPPVEKLADETEAQRAERLEREREAKRVNDEIDHAIELEKHERRKRKADVKIILLGQAESGKSTILRNFQLKFTPASFHAEVEAWRAVIDLNLVRSVTFLLGLLNEGAQVPPMPEEGQLLPLTVITDDLRRLRVRLSPLRNIEDSLARFLSPDDPSHAAPTPSWLSERAFEVSVRSGSKWKSLFSRKSSSSKVEMQGFEEVKNARRVIEACKEDVMELWAHPAIRASLVEQNVALEFQSGFFLDEVERIAAPGYEPSPVDVLKARIQTVGVEEHLLKMETSAELGQQWAIIDVGGSRGMRAAWVPYFDDVNVLVFLAPVSAFNQTLAEDRTVNRLWDSFLLWKSVCSNKLLKDVSFILLLNKYDILDAKLKSGIQFRHFVTSYRDRKNDTESVMIYMKDKFATIYRQYSASQRPMHVHVTCATDSTATSLVLARIREVIFTGNFERADLL